MKSLFDTITRLSLRFRVITLLSIVVVMLLGGIAGAQLKQELLPPIEFPQTFILAQVSGLSSEQVLNVVTERLEAEIGAIPEIVNLSSTSSGAIGAVITAANQFGLDQAKLRDKIQAAIDRVWFPSREIVPPVGEDGRTFGETRLQELTPEIAIYLAQESDTFAFQLSPQVWQLLPDDTVNALLGYLANQTSTEDNDQSALEKLIVQEVVPQLQTLSQVANVSVQGGQALLGDEQAFAAATSDSAETKSYLLQLSPTIWEVIQARVVTAGTLDQDAVNRFKQNAYPELETAPDLPQGWQAAHFSTADDLLEMQSLTKTVAGVLNDFATTGVILGALGQTDDLTADDVTRMLAIDPSLVTSFNAEQLAALPADVFAVLPTEYLDGLDGITKDTLAAASIAQALSGVGNIQAVDLPSSWQIQPPQIITFSLASIPLATFSIFSTSEEAVVATTPVVLNPEVTATPTVEATPTLPEGPVLPQLFSLIGNFVGADLNTADDLVVIQFSGDIAEQFGVTSLKGADFLNLLVANTSFNLGGSTGTTPDIDVAAFVGGLQECGFGLLDIDIQNPNLAKLIIGCITPETMEYLVQNDPTFLPALSAPVYDYLKPEVLELPIVSVRLADTWDTVRNQAALKDQALVNVADLISLSNDEVAALLNNVNNAVVPQFAGYEVRLFDSLTVAAVNEILREQPNFWAVLDAEVLLKLAPQVMELVPEAVVSSLTDEQRTGFEAIKSGEQPSAAQVLAQANVVVSDVVPTDPNAPALDSSWSNIANNAPGVDQLENASDLLRLPPSYGGAAAFINTILLRAGDFASQIIGTLSIEAVQYIVERDDTFLDTLDTRALLAIDPTVLAALPQAIQDRAASGDVFVPTNTVTRTNGSPSLLLTISKDQDANTIEAYYAVKGLLDRLDAENPNIAVAVAFEQSGLVEESISGVVREGALGAFFAVLIILVFLSGGMWNLRGRRITGIILLVLSVIFLAVVIGSHFNSTSTLQAAWDDADVVLRVIGLGGIVVGIAFLRLRRDIAHPAWRSTLVIAVSIPLSIFAALALMKWLPPAMHQVLLPLADGSPIFSFLLRLAPKELTLNIMTLSGLTVAVGRVVDDSIVVLENIFRQIQLGNLSKRDAILTGTRDVSVAIFSATGITVVVFLPLGLTGGLIGEFFLPFGLAVTYALLASFVVAITVIPVLVEMFVTEEEAHEEPEGGMQHSYVELLRWVLASNVRKGLVIALAILSAGVGVVLFGTRPQAFIPDFGDPQISVAIELPAGTPILETDKVARQAEEIIRATVDAEQLKTVSTIVGGGGFSLASLTGGSSISENRATITIGVESSEELENNTIAIREAIEEALGAEIATVSKATLTSQGGFGGFELVMSGNDQAQLFALEPCIVQILNGVEGIANVSSNLAQTGLGGGECNAGEVAPESSEATTSQEESASSSAVYLRINQKPALNFTGQVETEDTINLAGRAISAINEQIELPEGVTIGQGYNSQFQQEGFSGIFVAMGIAIVIVVLILILVFGSPVYWFAVIFSIAVAPVGAAIALTVTSRTLGISALIGLLMLLGLVVTNAVVLIDRVSSNRHERQMPVKEALLEAGGRRLRPILMTALATIIALMPLALGLSEGALIAEELGTVVIGGLLSSTLLTLVVVPAVYSLTSPLHNFFIRRDKATADS